MTTLRAGDGLALRHTAENDWRVAWGQRDWLGPLTARCGAGAAASNSAGDGAADLREANDRDFFGPYSGVEWNGQREGVRSSVRAYPESPLIIFRIECGESALAGLATGSFADPSVVWPHFVPKHRDPADMPAGLSSYGYKY